MKEANDLRSYLRGVITIYLTLVLLVMVSLITGCIFSAKVEAGRYQAANAVDQAMFSLFAHYDLSLLQKYHLFLMDGSCGTEHLLIESCLRELNESADQILCMGDPSGALRLSGTSHLLSLKRTGSAVTGYTLATDAGGAAFEAQALQSMYDTLGADGVSRLLSSFRNEPERSAGSVVPPAMEENPEEVEVPPDFKNPLPYLTTLKGMSLLSLVVDDPSKISKKTIHQAQFYSYRANEAGFGIVDTTGRISSVTDRAVFNLYLTKHYSNFMHPLSSSLLEYQLEYILGGAASDDRNLKTVLQKILFLREGLNLSFLYTDPLKRSQLQEEALVIASFLGNPALAIGIQAALAVGWAFLESIEDLHTLMSGKRIGLVKTQASWQVGLRNIPTFLRDRKALEKGVRGGVSYEDYLKLLLAAEQRGTVTTGRAIDMIEADLRGSGRPSFRMDHCLDSFSAEVDVLSEGQIPLTVERTGSYRNFEEARNAA